jgi:DNA-binding transcriptional LysR family regulator
MGRWDGIDEFLQVIETGSFTAAAEKLGVSKSYVSKQIGYLEDKLDARLLQRTTRKLTLTDIGEVFHEQCLKLSEQYERTETIVSNLQHKPRGTLRIAINSTYGVQYTAGAVAEFSRLHRELSVEVTSTYRDVDIVAEGYDLAMRYGHLENSSLIARAIGGHTLSLCGSPEYFEEYGVPETPEELRNHNCLTGVQRQWSFDRQGEDQLKVRVDGNWRSEDGATIYAAARSGIGLAQLPDFYIQSALETGELQTVPYEWSRYTRESWAVYPHSRHLSVKVRLFVDFLKEYFPKHFDAHRNFFIGHH